MLSVRWRLTLAYTSVLTCTLVLFSLFLYTVLDRFLLRHTDHLLITRANEVTRVLNSRRGPPRHGKLLPPRSVFASPGIYLQLLDGSGEVLAKSPNLALERLPAAPDTLARVRSGEAFFQTVGIEGEKLRLYNRPITLTNGLTGVLQVGTSLEPVRGMLGRLVHTLLLVGVIALAAAGALGYYLARTAMAPVKHLTRVAAAISETQDLARRVSHRGPPDEIGELAATFNRMLTRLADAQRSREEAYASHRRFVADVSHELRTPLTTIRGNLELLQRLGDDAGARREILADVVGEAERLSRLLNNLLTLARADAGQHIEKERLSLGQVAEEVARQAPLLGPARFVARDLELLRTAEVMGNADYLKQLLLILLDNAFKYTPPEGEVTLAAVRQGGWWGISVTDTGPGIAPEDLPRIFERFYRGRSGRAGGTGLGLAIARWITEEHGGRLEVASTPGRGTAFTLWLPV